MRHFVAEQGIRDWQGQGLRLDATGLYLQRLALTRTDAQGATLRLDARDIRLQPREALRFWPLAELRIGQLDIDWQPGSTPRSDTSSPLSIQSLSDGLRQLPDQLAVERLQLSLPCPAGRCLLQGSLGWQRPPTGGLPLEIQARLARGEHRLDLAATLEASDQRVSARLQLAADDQPRLQVWQSLEQQASLLHWQGTLALASLPESPWLIAWLGEWTALQPSTLPPLPGDLQLGASWAFSLPPHAPQRAEGLLRASAHLPSAWPLPGLGQIRGDLAVAIQASEGTWRPIELDARLDAQPATALLEALPSSLRPQHLQLALTPAATTSPEALALELALDVQGPLQAELHSPRLQLTLQPLGLQLEDARLRFKVERLDLPALDLAGLTGQVQLDAHLADEHLTLSVRDDSRLTARQLNAGPLQAQQLGLRLQGLQLHLDEPLDAARWRVAGPLRVDLARLDHPLLHPQPWHWQGRLEADASALSLAGQLGNAAGLTLDTRLQRSAPGGLRLTATLPELFLRGDNPLARTWRDWPATLQLQGGRLQAGGSLAMVPGSAPRADLTFTARGLTGILDRTELSGLEAEGRLELADDSLHMTLSRLGLQQANPGLPLGPALFQGEYRAALETPFAGRLDWREARLELLGGRLSFPPGSLDLAGGSLQARLDGLQLDALFAAYPAEGLHGSGLIDGQAQLLLGPEGPRIESGRLVNRGPGVLRLQSPRLQAMAQANPAMQLVAEALGNYHYDLLTGDIRYDAEGTLTLGLRLEGRNPALERGRAIHFNINLEEDIPALLTSLQLSDRVSETIQRRVREHLQRNRPPTAP